MSLSAIPLELSSVRHSSQSNDSMDIDGVDVDDGGIAVGGWPPQYAQAQAIANMAAMRILQARDPMPLEPLPLEPLPIELEPLPLEPLPIDSVQTSAGWTAPPMIQSSWASTHHAPREPEKPVQQRQVYAPQPIKPRAAPATEPQAPPIVLQPPPKPAQRPLSLSPPPVVHVEDKAKTPESDDEPMMEETKSQETAEIPTAVREIMVRVKESRLPIVEEEEGKLRESRVTGMRPIDVALAEARLITQNVYVQRKPREQEQDEISVCTCRRPEIPGQMGCLEDCVNRAALIECHPDYCPCRDRCDNQRIQRGLMPDAELIHAGNKGLGMVARQFIKRGDYVAEYMGEIVTEQEYHLRRLRYHNEKHRYMMVLSGGEVIDATRMGGLARFINHSCDPNCGVEKWEVRGEERCGIFARRDINPGEEICFDYKFESFSKLEITTCLCGASNCRGFIGINNQARKQPRKGSASHTAIVGDRHKPLDPITKKGTTSRKTLEHALERVYRAMAGTRVLTRKEVSMVQKSRLFLWRSLQRSIDSNMPHSCLEQYFVSEEDGEFEEMPPVFNPRELPDFPAKQVLESRPVRQQRLEAVVEKLRTHLR